MSPLWPLTRRLRRRSTSALCRRRLQEHRRRRELDGGQHRPDQSPLSSPWPLTLDPDHALRGHVDRAAVSSRAPTAGELDCHQHRPARHRSRCPGHRSLRLRHPLRWPRQRSRRHLQEHRRRGQLDGSHHSGRRRLALAIDLLAPATLYAGTKAVSSRAPTVAGAGGPSTPA